ncbi:MAG TPA: flagellar basal body rod C-terminal domain-containing protein [Dermatophilaceae bacterium]
MSIFGTMDAASSGLVVYRKWLDAVSDNIANINDVRSTKDSAFQARYVVAQAANYGNAGGTQVAGIALGDAKGRVVNQPDNPLADAEGNVRLPDIDLADQMGQLIIAQRGYQANLAVVQRAHDAYSAALQLGR